VYSTKAAAENAVQHLNAQELPDFPGRKVGSMHVRSAAGICGHACVTRQHSSAVTAAGTDVTAVTADSTATAATAEEHAGSSWDGQSQSVTTGRARTNYIMLLQSF
jgi:hypothetical protein